MSKPPVSIHDAFFKQIIGEPAMADRFLREHLPPEVVALLGEDLPEVMPGSFVDEDLAQHHTDLLFKLRLRGGEEALVHLVAEHKSAPDPMARLQLLRYVTRVLSDWHRKHGTLPLPAVIPLLAHHGPAGWEISVEFFDLFGAVPDPLRPYLPSFRHALIDLARIPDEGLSAHLRLRAFLKALKYILRKDLSQRIEIVLAEAGGLEMMDTVLILRYLDKGPVAVGREEVRAALTRLVPGRMEEIMGHLTQPAFEEGKMQGIAQGKAEGRAEGKAEGKAEGRAEALLLLLEARFGSLSKEQRQRVEAADMALLEVWFKQAIMAPDLTAIFGTRN